MRLRLASEESVFTLGQHCPRVNACDSVKIPVPQTKTLPPFFLEIAFQNFFQPHQRKNQTVMGAGAGGGGSGNSQGFRSELFDS